MPQVSPVPVPGDPQRATPPAGAEGLRKVLTRPRVKASAVRAYDIRGVYDRDLGVPDARALGLSYATVARSRGLCNIAVSRDGRLSSPELEEALISGLADGGMRVRRIGVGPTPRLTFAVRTLGLDGGIMVTASHNPPDENGFKLLLGAERVHGAGLKALVETDGTRAEGGWVRDAMITDAYVRRLAEEAGALKAFRVAWDCGHGATAEVLKRLVARLPGEHLLLNAEIDGRFPAHHPDPAVAENLRELQDVVRARDCDLGVAFDGDGDRIGVVDGSGAVIWADQLMLFLAIDLLVEHPGATVVGDVKCSRVLFDGVRALQGRAVAAPSGYVRVREVMLAEGALLAGELSGHVFFDRWEGADDALHAAVRTLGALSRAGRSLAEFRAGLPDLVATPEVRWPCPDALKHQVVARAARQAKADGLDVDAVDGVRVTTADGWWLLRASGTEPKLTVRCEAFDPEGLERLKTEVKARLADCGVRIAL
jgi:phosphomannomutase